MSGPPRRRSARPFCCPQGTDAGSAAAKRTDVTKRSPCAEAPVGPEYTALVAALLHLQEALGFPCGIPTQRQTAALRSTRRYRALVAHLPEWPEEGP